MEEIDNSLQKIKQLIFKCRDEHLKNRAESRRELERMERDIDNLIMWSDSQDREIVKLRNDLERIDRYITYGRLKTRESEASGV